MIKKIFSIIVMITALSSCATQRMVFDNSESQSKSLAYQGSAHFVIHGLYQRYSFDVAKHCGNSQDNIHSVEVGRSGGQVVTTFFTGGLYAPKYVRVYCKK